MFKGMHPVFWIGLGIMYGLSVIFWIFEITLPGSVFAVKIGGAAAPFFYGNFFLLFAVNLFLAWLWYYIPEKEAEKKEMRKGADKGVSTS